MNYDKLIQKREIKIGDKAFCVSKIPAIEATKIYPSIAKYYSDHGLIGLTMFDVELCKKILAYTAAYNNGKWETLELESIIDQTFDDQFVMKKLVLLMVKENWGFLMDGSLRELLEIPEGAMESAS